LDTDFDLTITGFSTPEIDLIFHDNSDLIENEIEENLSEELDIPSRVKQGDLWQLGKHYLYCGDSLNEESYQILLGDKKANMVFTDPPYNVRIDGHVSGKGKVKHEEFAFASGEMSTNEFVQFLETSFSHLKNYSTDGSLHFVCMDWRHSHEILQASKAHYADCKNICVWNKQIGGMGSLYRSQHEFIYVFKNGTKPHINNIELGKHGRNRTNIWDYPGAGACSVHHGDLKLHPTVKPVSMIADAIRDCSKQGQIILDNFAGSGSTLLAAEKTKRKAYVIEYEPKYCDVILWRFEKETGLKAVKVTREEFSNA
jgi:DNA modification methylase